MLEARRRSTFLQSVRAAALADFESELVMIERIAVLRAAGFKRTEVSRLLGVTDTAAFKRLEARLESAAERLDNGTAA